MSEPQGSTKPVVDNVLCKAVAKVLVGRQTIFELAHQDYEEYSPRLFEHLGKTEQEFKQDVRRAIRECADEYLTQETGWVGIDRWLDFADKKLVEYGYQPIKPYQVSFFGGGILCHGGKEDEEDSAWREVVGDSLFERAKKMNARVEEEIHGRRLKRRKEAGESNPHENL